jgi:hypothetical protein
MNHQPERRAANPAPDDALSPEVLALLVTCGAEVRESDRAAVAMADDGDASDRRSQARRVKDRRGGDRRGARP